MTVKRKNFIVEITHDYKGSPMFNTISSEWVVLPKGVTIGDGYREPQLPLAVRNEIEAKRIREMKIKKENTEMKNLVVIKAPEKLTNGGTTVFLAGSIEMGKAIDWQTQIEDKLKEKLSGDQVVTLFNPRRDDWDSSWEQTIENDNFREQVQWELNALEDADKIVVYIDPETKSPITLLELGIYARGDNMCVCCPEGFYRKGNVDVVCDRYDVPMVDNIDGLVKFILDESN
tara:strand:+ start:2463 stop:3155 length:693 start_codon:yes stop_codon:yes gene_type:complete